MSESGSLTRSDIHILYIEDDEGLARLLQKQLHRRSGYHVDVAEDAEQGLRKLQQQHYDMTIVDYNLPVLSGLQLLHILRDNGIDVPVIILTGVGTEEIAAEVMRAGAVDYLVKDVGEAHVDKICAAIQRVWVDQQKKIQQKMVFAKRRLAEKVFDVTEEGIIVTDGSNIIEAVNPAFTTITGYSYEEAIGKTPSLLKSGQHDDQFFKRMWKAIEKNDFWEGEIWNKRKSGEEYPEWLAINAIREKDGQVSQYIGVFTDISKRKEDEKKIWHQANFDPLTDLPNRSLLVDRAAEALRRARREHTEMAMMFIDLDRFKYINDHYGHAVGDEFLIEVGKRISSALRESDTVIRLSGDEFIVLMPLIQHVTDAGRVAEKITSAISAAYIINDSKTYVSASVGIAVYPGDGDSVETLLSHADMAMYKAKENGRNQHLFFDHKMNEEAEQKASIEHELMLAIKDDQLVLYFQPVTNLKCHRITHAEALIRWNHPEKGLIMPNDFIPIAEESGLIIQLGEWVIDAVCNQLKLWQRVTDDLKICLNVSPIQMMHANLDKQLQASMTRCAPPNGSIIIEITENVMIEGPEKIKEKLDAMKEMGLSFLIDDFGTGFSSMRYLKKLPFDGLKIDRGFVANVDADNEKAVLVQAMIEMAHRLNLKVVAEGVEREEELAYLRSLDCDYVQGYLLGRPMPAEQFLALLTSQQ
ncbi:cyclic di-GMP phosphodiesterase Gmr [Mariprofundus micogutta]|uniref:Cyclic di-GMP phosphodiesterase Gmr n=1 Tax=Mariprofundus micogutta TaxID=1921010 RepID=A0A1L8CP37_9PROT|nr:GGDEF domain-containing response regulator [Mariprofundus micogutta]GAV20686.1 cyclic di-GMP phosphodiesterase Gmr [Mariprofundus micogutta]